MIGVALSMLTTGLARVRPTRARERNRTIGYVTFVGNAVGRELAAGIAVLAVSLGDIRRIRDAVIVAIGEVFVGPLVHHRDESRLAAQIKGGLFVCNAVTIEIRGSPTTNKVFPALIAGDPTRRRRLSSIVPTTLSTPSGSKNSGSLLKLFDPEPVQPP